MDSSLLDQNTVSIIRSPNKQFYFMAALDSNDLEHFGVTRGEFKVHDNALGYHPTDNIVNGWNRHANEQVSIDNVTGMTHNKINEKKPNKGMNCLCDATSSEFLPINMQKPFDISNSYSANLAIAQNDSYPGLPATTSSAAAAVLQVDHTEHNRIASCLEGMSPSEAHSKNDVVNAVSLAKLCDLSDVHHGLEGGCYNPPPPSTGHGCYNPPPPPSSGHGCYNPPPLPSSGHGCYNPPPPPSSGQVKGKQSLRKSVKKTKSLHNICNNSRKNCGQRLSSDTDTSSNQNNVRMKSGIRIESVLCNAVSVQPCGSSSISVSSSSSGQLSSRRRLSHRVRSIGESSRSENSDGNGDCETCGNEEDALTSGFTSAGQESTTAIDETWDGYQVPLYAAISDDSSEEKLDASNLLQIEWQPLNDEFMDFTDFGNNSGSHGQREDESSEVDSDTDVEELIHLINESSDALRLTRLSLNELKRNNASGQSSLHREPLATCSTNINCLRDLLDLVNQNEWTHAEVNQLSDLLKQWQNVESEFLCLTFRNDVSTISHRDSDHVIIDVSQNDLPVSPVSQKTSNNSSDFDMTMIESPSSRSCYYECCNKSFSNRFDVFNYNISKLVKGSGPLHEATLAPFQFVLFIILLLIFFYLIAFNSHWTGIVGIKFDPQLRYVLGPPPL